MKRVLLILLLCLFVSPVYAQLDFAKEPPTDFKPEIVFERWNETLSIEYYTNEDSFTTQKLENQKQIWEGSKQSVEYFKIQNDLYEYQVILKEKPLTNVFTFKISSTNLVYYYQNPLNEIETPPKGGGANETHVWDEKNNTLIYRPIDIVGSYAVYHKTGWGNEYKAGKAFHIYRPKGIDANGLETWLELSIDEKIGIMSITVPKPFLDFSKYPITIDPIFGKSDVGGTTQFGGKNYISGHNSLVADGDGNVTSMHIYLKNTGGAGEMKLGVYNLTANLQLSAPDNLLYGSPAFDPTANNQWENHTIAGGSEPEVTNDTWFYLCYRQSDDLIQLVYDNGGADSQKYKFENFPNAWPDPFGAESNNTKNFSLYANYTVGGAPPANNAPDTEASSIPNLDTTDNMYSQYKNYTFLLNVSDADGGDEIHTVRYAMVNGTNWINGTIEAHNSNAHTFTSGGTRATVDTITNSTAGNNNNFTIPLRLDWDIWIGTDWDIYGWCNDTSGDDSGWDLLQNNYFDTVNDTVISGFTCDDDRGNLGATITFTGTVYYENDPFSGVASTLYPPDAEFTSVDLWNSTNDEVGTDATIVNGAFSIAITSENTVGLENYSAYVDLSDADATDEEKAPTDTYISDALMFFLSINDNRVNVADTIYANLNATYAYDGTSITDGTIQLNGTNMIYQSGNWWQLGRSQSTVDQWTYVVDTASENVYNITQLGIINLENAGDRFVILDSNDFAFASGFTLAVWADPTLTDASGFLIEQYDVGSGDGFLLFQSEAGLGVWAMQVFVGGVSKTIVSDNAPSGGWEHIVGMRESDGTLKMYVDGVLQADTDTLAGAINSSNSVYVGSFGDSVIADYDGLLCEHRFYNRSLQEPEIYQLYQGRQTNNTGLIALYTRPSYDMDDALWRDLSGNGHDGVIVGATVIVGTSTDETVRPIWDRIAIQTLQVNSTTLLHNEMAWINFTAQSEYDAHVLNGTEGDSITLQDSDGNNYVGTWNETLDVWEANRTEAIDVTRTLNTYTSVNEATYTITVLNMNGSSLVMVWGAGTVGHTFDLRVIMLNGSGIDGVTVLCENATTTAFNVQTNSTGYIAQQTIESDNYTFTLTRLGYITVEFESEITNNTDWVIYMLTHEEGTVITNNMRLEFFGFLMIAIGSLYYGWKEEDPERQITGYGLSFIFWIASWGQFVFDNSTSESVTFLGWVFMVPLMLCAVKILGSSMGYMETGEKRVGRY
jgi:hypothetical protein